ncbi:MAG: CocE/NonD family hydrolase [Oscillospiraceae bacterium]
MEFRKFVYYRAGVAIARFRISFGGALCAPRDLRTLAYEEERPFRWPMEPFDAELDKRLAEAVCCVQANTVPGGYEKTPPYTAVVRGQEKTVENHIQPQGKNPLDLLVSEGRIVAAIDNERNYVGLLVEEGWEAATPQADMGEASLSRAEYGIEFVGTEMVPMRDGVRLATDVYLPAQRRQGQRFPTVLIRTCYNKFSASQFFAFVHYGYAVVAQDTRGRELSEGVWQPIINEKDDGDDTLNWIAAQDWSDGGVGMIGASYLAIVQWQAAASGNPHFKAAISMVTGGVPFFDFPHRCGVLSPGTIAWIVSMRKKHFAPEDMERDDWDRILKHRPIREIPRAGIGEEISFWNEWMEHEYYDGYWHKGNFLVHQDKIDVPAMYVTGWYDDVGPGSMQVWDMNKRNGRANQKLICGAWKHKMNISRDIHGNCYGPASVRYDMFYRYLRWYDRFLKGVDNGVEKEAPVEYFVIGEDRWHSASAWPPAEAVETELFLSSGGHANTSEGDGSLGFAAPARQGEDRYTYDPADPTPFLIDISENECLVPENYREVERRGDVLVYTSEPLEKPLTVAGEPVAVLYASSSAKDTDWVVRVTDVDGEGNSIRLCDGIVRAKFRRSFIEPKLLLPGEIVRYEIPLTWIANRFAPGHRIRVEVTSGADNSLFCNTNTGLPIADDTGSVVAEQTVYHGGRYRSRVILPVLED